MDPITTSDPDDPKQTCFIIMPYAKEFDLVHEAIKDAMQNVGLRCSRLKEARYIGKITKEMVARIAKSQLCIADLTGPNQNVMWETGYAMALKRPIVLISQDAKTLPFNLKDYHVFEYDLSKGQRAISLEVEAAIRVTLKQSRKARATRWAAAAAGVVLTALVGFFVPKMIHQPYPEPSPRCDLIHVARGADPIPIDAETSIELVHIETLQGNIDDRVCGGGTRNGTKGGAKEGQDFNRSLPNAEEIVTRILGAASLDTEPAKDILEKTQEQWDQYLLCLPDKNRGYLTDYPFVRFKVEQDGKRFILPKYYFIHDIVEITRDGAPSIKLKLEHIYNTKKSSDEPESVALRLVT